MATSASRAVATFALALALIRSVASVWFSSEIVETPRNTEVAAPRQTERVVLVVVDGLRYDTALESDLMPRLQAIARAGTAGVSTASLVTMTGLGVRTLGTGTSPALADILLETHLPPVTFDNLFASLRARGDHIAWLGNTAWRELFGASIDIDAKIDTELDMMSRANNVWAADRVIVRRAVAMMSRRDWSLFVVHIGGLDNASHRFTPFGEEFRAKARAVDADLDRLVQAAGAATTVIITSDHGTSDRGHHGSGEPITRRTPLVFTGAATRSGRRVDAHQTDIAPTIAALLAVPIPAPSEGEILLDALALTPDAERDLRAANVAQLQRYADAYGVARGLEPPTIAPTAEGMRALGDWIEATRSSSGLAPALWALSLLLAALAWLGTPGRRVAVASAIAIVLSALCCLGLEQSVILGGLALCASAFAAVVALRGAPCRWRAGVVGAAVLLGIELGVIAWKLHHRFVEMKMNDVYGLVHLSDRAVQAVLTLLAAVGATLLARARWPHGRWAMLGVLFGASALADSIAIPAALVAGMAAAAASARPRELAAIIATAALGVGGLVLADNAWLAAVPLAVGAPLVLAATGAALSALTRRGRLCLLAFGLAASAVRLAGDPAGPYRITLGAICVGAIVMARLERTRDGRSLALVGWAGAIALAMLSRSAQEPGLLGWVTFAAIVGRCSAVARSDDRAVLVATLSALAVRFACFGLFEGAFELSHLEVWVAYQGNPSTTVAFGAAVIAIKFALPLVVALALVVTHMEPAARRRVVTWTIVFLCLRIAHIVIAMTFARGTFYSPYYDSGQLVFTYLMLLSGPVAVAVLEALA